MKLLRLLLLSVLLAYLAILIFPALSGYLSYKQTKISPLVWERIEEARRGTGYRLGDTWTTFPLTGIGDTLRLVVNVGFRPQAEARTKDPNHPPRWAYGFLCEYLGDNGAVVGSRTYDAYAGWPPSKENFFVDEETVVTPGSVFLVDLKGYQHPAKMRIRLRNSDPEIAEVTVRAYMRQRFTGRTLEHRWNRLTPEQRVLLASGNLYPPELLRENERRNLMTNLWNPLGPEGVPNANYFVRELYSVDTEETPPPDPRFSIPQGMALDATHRATLPVPREGAKLRLEFVNPEGQPPKEDQGAFVRWYGKELGEKKEWNIPAIEVAEGHEFEASGGLIEIDAKQPLFMRVYRLDADQKTEITPPPLVARGFLVSAERPVEYVLFHSNNAPTRLRADLRRFLPNTEAAQGFPQAQARYQIVAVDGQLLHEDILALPAATPSPYDRFADRTLESVLSDPDTFYFVMPAEARVFRISSDTPLAVNVSVRPGDLVREQSIPADYWAYDPTEERQAAWFPKRAENYTQWIAEDLAPIIITQYRPPEDNPILLSGDFEWTSYLPEGPWRGRMLLTPRESGLPFRPRILDSTYVPVTPRTPMQLAFEAYSGIPEARPRLLYARARHDADPLTILLDGQAVIAGTLVGSSGELELPPFSVPRIHTLEIKTPHPADFFVNQVNPERMPADTQAYSRKMAVRIGKDSMRFPFDKKTPEEEVLSFQYFIPESGQSELVLHVRIESTQPLLMRPVTKITHLDHRFYVAFDENPASKTLGAGEKPLIASPAFFVPFGSDLPAGVYSVSVELEQGPEGYIVLSSTAPGHTEKRGFRREESWTSIDE